MMLMPHLLRRAIIGLALILLMLIGPATARAGVWLAPGEPLDHAHLEALVKPALPPGERFQLAFEQPVVPLHNPASSEAFMQLMNFRHEPRTERFAGSFLVRLESGEERVLALAGRAQMVIEILVPTRTIAAGERLARNLMEPLLVVESRLRSDTLTEPMNLLDMEARRRLLAGRPVRQGDVQAPQLVRRGEAVEVVYRAPGLELVATARALEDGGRGSLVTIVTLDTGKRLTGIVSNPGEVVVGAGTARGALQ